MKKIYEGYHGKRKMQKRIINRDNFTYKNILVAIEEYGRGSRYLDIGCGVGTIAFYLAFRGKRVWGIDISKGAIAFARKNADYFGFKKNVTFLVKDFPDKFLKGKYDTIICSEVLEHLADDKRALLLISRALNKSSVLILTVPSINAPLYRAGFLGGFDKKVGHLRRYSLDNLTVLLKALGLKIVYSKKTEGVFRNSLFAFPLGSMFAKLANKIFIVSALFSIIDDFTLSLFGESQIIIVAVKK